MRGTDVRTERTPEHRLDGPDADCQAACVLVVGVNSRDPGAAALHESIKVAGLMKSHLHIVHVRDNNDAPLDPDSADWEPDLNQAIALIRNRTVSALDESNWKNWSYLEFSGDPATVLHDEADAVDAVMIVIGVPQRDVVARMGEVLGDTVSARLIHRSRRPVLSVPTEAN